MSQLGTFHDSRAVMECAKLWHDQIITFPIKAKLIFQDLDYDLINILWNGSQNTLKAKSY